MHKKVQKIVFMCVCMVAFSACVTQKRMMYLSNAQPESADSINQHFQSRSEAIVRAGDALSITVSALDQEAVVPYNLPMVAYAKPGDQQLTTTPSLQYYVVNEEGNIDFPVLGSIHVAGLKRTEVQDMLKSQLETQVLNPMVNVILLNAKVSVMGEVVRPGTVQMTSGRLTILDALAAAGDLTPYGRRDNVLVTREVDGKLEIARLNLLDAALFSSPYYFLQQNDVVYVSPNKVRAVNSVNAGLWVSVVGTLASTTTVVVTVVNAAKK